MFAYNIQPLFLQLMIQFHEKYTAAGGHMSIAFFYELFLT